MDCDLRRVVGSCYAGSLTLSRRDPIRAPPQVSLEPASEVAVTIDSAAPLAWQGDLLAIGVFEECFDTVGGSQLALQRAKEAADGVLTLGPSPLAPDEKPVIKDGELQALDAELGGALADIVSLFEFKGKAGSSQAVRVGKGGARWVALCGLGPAAKAATTADWGKSTFQVNERAGGAREASGSSSRSSSTWNSLFKESPRLYSQPPKQPASCPPPFPSPKSLGSAVADAAKSSKAKTAAVVWGLGAPTPDAAAAAAAAGGVAHGLLSGAYESTRFKTKPTPSPLKSAALLLRGGGDAQAASAAVARGAALARGALLTRFLVEAPPNVATPSHLAAAAAAIAAAAPDVMNLKVLEKDECEALGMGLFLGVAEASAEPPKFIHLTYTPAGGAAKDVALVGKGLTFDSGGERESGAGEAPGVWGGAAAAAALSH